MKMLELQEAVQNLVEWQYSKRPGSEYQAHYWALKVHHLSTLILLELQDKTNGSYQSGQSGTSSPEEDG